MLIVYFYLHTDPGEVAHLKTFPIHNWPNIPNRSFALTIQSHVTKLITLGRKLHGGTFKTKESRAGLVRVPLCWKLSSNIINSVPCDRIVQSSYSRPDLECTIFPYFRQKRLKSHQYGPYKVVPSAPDTPIHR